MRTGQGTRRRARCLAAAQAAPWTRGAHTVMGPLASVNSYSITDRARNQCVPPFAAQTRLTCCHVPVGENRCLMEVRDLCCDILSTSRAIEMRPSRAEVSSPQVPPRWHSTRWDREAPPQAPLQAPQLGGVVYTRMAGWSSSDFGWWHRGEAPSTINMPPAAARARAACAGGAPSTKCRPGGAGKQGEVG